MAGVTANESYYVDNVGDVLNEDAAGATDTVFATVGFSLTAGQEVEVLRAYGAVGGLFLRGNDPHEQGGPDRVGPVALIAASSKVVASAPVGGRAADARPRSPAAHHPDRMKRGRRSTRRA